MAIENEVTVESARKPLLGLSSRYGLVRYWWVAVKLVLNLLLTGLVLVALAPEVAAHAEQARQFVAGEPATLVERMGFRSIAWEEDWTTGLQIDPVPPYR